MRKRIHFMTAAAALAWFVFPARAEEQKPPEEKNPWAFALGVSYLGTTGNTKNQTFGADFGFKRLTAPWGLEGGLSYMRGGRDGEKTAERTRAAVKGSRHLNSRWDGFLSGTWERDRFSGFDSRLGLASGATFKPIAGPRDELQFDLGLSWNRDRTVDGSGNAYLGGLLQMRFLHNWTPSSKFQQRWLFVPDFVQAARWHGESETAIITVLVRKLAFKGTFLLRYNHRPPDGFKKTDTTTSLSLVYSF